MAFTMYGRRLLMDCTFMSATRPTTVYFALTVAVPTASDDATLLVEPTAANYARQSYAVSSGFYVSSPGELVNTSVITFPTPAVDWGYLRGWAMCTQSTGGLVIVSGPLKQPRRASAGTTLKVGIDAIKLTLR